MTSRDTLRVMTGITRGYMDSLYKSLCIQTCTDINYSLNMVDTAKEITRLYNLMFFNTKDDFNKREPIN